MIFTVGTRKLFTKSLYRDAKTTERHTNFFSKTSIYTMYYTYLYKLRNPIFDSILLTLVRIISAKDFV